MASPAANVEDQMVTGITKRQWREIDAAKKFVHGDRLSIEPLLFFRTSNDT